MRRKQFITTFGALWGGVLVGQSAGFTGNSKPVSELLRSASDEETFWKIIREQFVFPGDYSYLNTGGIGAVPVLVSNRIKTRMDELEIYPKPGHDLEKWHEIKEKCANLLGTGVNKEELALISTATEGINIILNGLPLTKGDEIITSTHEHPALHIPLLNKFKQEGITIKTFQPDFRKGLGNVERIEKLISKRTRLIFISHVTCTTGQLFPVEEIGKLARTKRIWYALDGAQATGSMKMDIKKWNVDFYTFSGHKWVLGPKRTGVLYVREELLDTLKPTTVGAYSDNGYNVIEGSLSYYPSAQRYEYATQNEALFHGLGTAVNFINTIGLSRINEHNRNLSEQFYNGLKDIKQVQILSPEQQTYRGSMITFKLKDKNYHDLASFLSKKRIRVRVVPEANLEGIRVSFHIYNNESDVQRILYEIQNFRS